MKSSPLALTVLSLLSYQPLHPYGIRRLIKQWGKDDVVNVGQPASLYRTIERLQAGGLVAVSQTERDQRYPERTVYEITDAGREVAGRWLAEMISAPVTEFPQFPAALSFVMMLSPAELAFLLDQRANRLAASLAEIDASLGAEPQLPRITMLDTEYLRAVIAAELDWVQSTAADLKAGRLRWSEAELTALANAQEAPGDSMG
ncbi:MAG TPA: PadR family transcriptional regulator [Streptosporangiaceae bacterium]|nr:PadR family transcriptional regulator [Streptosporangiaceae bacterium]